MPYKGTPNMTALPRAKANEANASEAETENWSWRLRKWIVKKGISIMCPNSSLSTNVAADIPLFRGGMRLTYLKALAALGINNFVARSGLGYNFVCHVGDLAAFPFYHPGAYRAELELASAWLRMTEQPLAFDVGANEGFFRLPPRADDWTAGQNLCVRTSTGDLCEACVLGLAAWPNRAGQTDPRSGARLFGPCAIELVRQKLP